MILLTGATGLIGGDLLPMLLDTGKPVRALVRDPRGLGQNRVKVQLALGDLADPFSMRNALRGVDTVVHLAATIRDQPKGTIEELNGLATLRLLRAAERAGVERFVFFSAIGATDFQRTRFFRSKALGEKAVLDSDELEGSVFAPSIVYAPGDPWVFQVERLANLPALPISGTGKASYQPLCSRDVARAVISHLQGNGDKRRYELAGPETLTYDEIATVVAKAAGRERPLVHVPEPVVKAGLRTAELVAGDKVFATWEEAELMEVPMVAAEGTADIESLGVTPVPIAEVLAH
jgi:NADH dehydrogenase